MGAGREGSPRGHNPPPTQRRGGPPGRAPRQARPAGRTHPQKPQGQRGGRLGALLRSLPASPMAAASGAWAAGRAGGGAAGQGCGRDSRPVSWSRARPTAVAAAGGSGGRKRSCRARPGPSDTGEGNGRPRPSLRGACDAAAVAARHPLTQQCPLPRCSQLHFPLHPAAGWMVSPGRRISWERRVPTADGRGGVGGDQSEGVESQEQGWGRECGRLEQAAALDSSRLRGSEGNRGRKRSRLLYPPLHYRHRVVQSEEIGLQKQGRRFGACARRRNPEVRGSARAPPTWNPRSGCGRRLASSPP